MSNVDPDEFPAVCQPLSELLEVIADARGEAMMAIAMRMMGEDPASGGTVVACEVATANLGHPDAALMAAGAALSALIGAFQRDVDKQASPDALGRLARAQAAYDALTTTEAGEATISIQIMTKDTLQ